MWSQSEYSSYYQSQPAHPFYHAPYRWVDPSLSIDARAHWRSWSVLAYKVYIGVTVVFCISSFCIGERPQILVRNCLYMLDRVLLLDTRLNVKHVRQGLYCEKSDLTAGWMLWHEGNPTGPVKLASWVISVELHTCEEIFYSWLNFLSPSCIIHHLSFLHSSKSSWPEVLYSLNTSSNIPQLKAKYFLQELLGGSCKQLRTRILLLFIHSTQFIPI